jgi:hypothetical protein
MAFFMRFQLIKTKGYPSQYINKQIKINAETLAYREFQ